MDKSYTPLAAYFMSFPVGVRREKWQNFATAHGVTVKQAYYYTKNHPRNFRSLGITEEVTQFKVTRFEIFPEIFSLEELKTLIAKVSNET